MATATATATSATSTRRARITSGLAAAAGIAALLAPAHAAGAATTVTTVPGVQVSVIQQDGATRLSMTLDTARSLAVTCSAAGQVSANGVALPAPCTNLSYLQIYGSAGSDTITVEGKGLAKAGIAPYIAVGGGAGNDTIKVTHQGGQALLEGGPGSDRLSSGVYNAAVPGIERLTGDDGDDVLTNLGFLNPSPPTFAAADRAKALAWAATLVGGAGGDRIVGSPTRPDGIDMDTTDTVTMGTGPAIVRLSLTQQTDLVTIHQNGNYGTSVSSVRSGVTWSLTLPTLTYDLAVDTLGGPDQVLIDKKSTTTHPSIDTGTGQDVLTIRPWPGYRAVTGTVSQPGAQPIDYNAKRTVKVVVKPL